MSQLLIAIWPFVSEMFFGGKSIKEVVLANKFKSFLFLLLCLSIFLNYVAFGKIYDIAVARREENSKTSVASPNTAQPHAPGDPPSPADKASAPGKAASNNQGAASRTHEDEVRDKLQNIFK